MTEVSFRGRYGQPVGRWAALVAEKALKEGRYVQTFESFAAFRPGASLEAIVRISNSFIRTRSSNSSESDVVVVLDNSLFEVSDVTRGLKAGGVVVAAGEKPGSLTAKGEFQFFPLELIAGSSQENRTDVLLKALYELGVLGNA